MPQKIERSYCFDIIKYLAIFLVMITHFAVGFESPVSSLWNISPYSFFLKGIDGKLGVTVFAVISGYFAAKGAEKRTFVQYFIKRYLSFFIYCLIANSLCYLINFNQIRETASFGFVIGQSVMLGDGIFPTFWFIRDFLIGMNLSFILGKHDIGLVETFFLIVVFLFLKKPFISAVLPGCVSEKLIKNDNKLFNEKKYLIPLFIFSLLLIRTSDSDLSNFGDGINIVFLILLISKIRSLYSIKRNIISYFGSMSMSLLITHVLMMSVIQSMGLWQKLSPFVLFVFWFVSTHLSAIILHNLYRLLEPFIDICMNRVQAICKSLL